jgi:hypothetical protein
MSGHRHEQPRQTPLKCTDLNVLLLEALQEEGVLDGIDALASDVEDVLLEVLHVRHILFQGGVCIRSGLAGLEAQQLRTNDTSMNTR